MAYSAQTAHYGLPLPIGSDKSTFLDTNEAFATVDTALYNAVTAGSETEQEVQDLNTEVAGIQSTIAGIQTDVGALQNGLTSTNLLVQEHAEDITALEGDMNTAEGKIAVLENDLEPTTVDFDTTGATSGLTNVSASLTLNAYLYQITAAFRVTATGATTEEISSGRYGLKLGTYTDSTGLFSELNVGERKNIGYVGTGRPNEGMGTAQTGGALSTRENVYIEKTSTTTIVLYIATGSSQSTYYGRDENGTTPVTFYANVTTLRASVAHKPMP